MGSEAQAKECIMDYPEMYKPCRKLNVTESGSQQIKCHQLSLAEAKGERYGSYLIVNDPYDLSDDLSHFAQRDDAGSSIGMVSVT